MKKKLLSLALVLVMCLSLLPAGALAENKTGWTRENGNWYYYDTDGAKHNGWLKYDGKWYYCENGLMVTGRREIKGESYSFAANGEMQTGWVELEGLVSGSADNRETLWGYYGSDGKGYSGWWKMDDGWHYFDHGKPARYITLIGDVVYGFDKNGVLASGWEKMRFGKGFGDDDWFWGYFNEDGSVYDGWLEYNGSWYYIDNGQMLDYPTSVSRDDYTIYGFGSDGRLVTGWYLVTDFFGNARWHYFDSDGKAYDGWLKDNEKWYYIDNGRMATGKREIDGNTYYFRDSGSMVTGWQYINGTWYYFRASGAMKTGWLNDGGTWYYFDASGAMATGWLKIGSTWYYFESSGAMAAGETVNGYTFNASGAWIG